MFAPGRAGGYAWRKNKKSGGKDALHAGSLSGWPVASRSVAAVAQAQSNPQRQITVVVPIGAGGGVDATGRLFAEKLAERLKQPVVVENRTGAGGLTGTDSVAKAAPDGHTILLMESSRCCTNGCTRSVPFDVVADFTPIARVAISPLVLFAQPSFAPEQRARADRARQGRARQALAAARPASARRIISR